MYEKVRKEQKPRSSLPLVFWTAVCLVILGSIIGLIGWAGGYVVGFRNFVGDLSNSTHYAYENQSLILRMDGEEYPILPENIYPIYTRISTAGSGRLGEPPAEAPAAVLTYGDGSYMELWTVKLVNPSNGREYGLLINYVNQNGDTYCYDTDKLTLSSLPLEKGKN